MLNTLQLILNELMSGLMPVYQDISKAQDELDEAARLLSGHMALPATQDPTPSITVVDPRPTANDATLDHLGQVLLAYLTLIEEMRRDGSVTHVTSEAASTIIEARAHLLANNYEPARLKRFNTVKFKTDPDL